MKRVPALLCVLAAGCGITAPTASELADARARWHSTEPAVYEFTMSRSCECPPALSRAVVVQVKDGVVERRRYAGTDSSVNAELFGAFPSIDGVFAIVDSAIAHHAFKLGVTYDQARGFPTSIGVDLLETYVDDEYNITVWDFKVRAP